MLRLSLLVEPISANMPLSNRGRGGSRGGIFLKPPCTKELVADSPLIDLKTRGLEEDVLSKIWVKISSYPKKKQVALQFLEPNIAEY